ncbi:MAG: bifunctional precorrin-2 dehydrogenase/sirohydrochlorin ferrochelatase [Eubacterium sp.]|nr:bifunctional precorrin-2 dehydrogenase/sirohydrochlorin ferrochelatase [Eubacterium sp.]
MAYFPFMMDIKKKDCLIVGGGLIAGRKAQMLLQYEPDITVIAPQISQIILDMQEENSITVKQRTFEETDLKNRFMVIAATADEQLNREIAKECKRRGILVNAVDMTDDCSFIFPAIIKKKNLLISISSGGDSPAGAAYLKKHIEKCVPEGYERNLEVLGKSRELVKRVIASSSERTQFYYSVLQKVSKTGQVLNGRDIVKYLRMSYRQDSLNTKARKKG